VEKLKKKKNTKEYEVGVDPRLKRTLDVLGDQVKLCAEQSAKYKVRLPSLHAISRTIRAVGKRSVVPAGALPVPVSGRPF
jgi:hypothetical protein